MESSASALAAPEPYHDTLVGNRFFRYDGEKKLEIPSKYSSWSSDQIYVIEGSLTLRKDFFIRFPSLNIWNWKNYRTKFFIYLSFLDIKFLIIGENLYALINLIFNLGSNSERESLLEPWYFFSLLHKYSSFH